MKLLIIDKWGNGLDLGLRAQAYGHDVRLFIGPDPHNGERCTIGDGLIKKVTQWESSMNWADLIFLVDNDKYMRGTAGYRAKGYPIFGPNTETARWELDRQYGQKILQNAGIEIIPTKSFKKYQEARDYVIKTQSRLVCKPNGDAARELSYLAPKINPVDNMIFMLDKWHKDGMIQDEFVMQEFIPGQEFAVGGFFGPKGFSSFFLENFEHKKLMNDDKGVNTGEMGTVIKYTQKSQLAEELLLPLVGQLHKAGHTGYIDVSAIIDESGKPRPLEFTTRPGIPLEQIRMALERDDPIGWMYDLTEGRDTFRPTSDVAVGIVAVQPGFPLQHSTKKDLRGYPVYGLDSDNLKHVHLIQCEYGEAPYGGKGGYEECIVSSGDYLYVVTGTGKTVSQAKARAYKTNDTIAFPNSLGYRTDIGDRLEKALPKLQQHGYCLDWVY